MTKKHISIASTIKRAAIYVRVSDEERGKGEEMSPVRQESDCRELCDRQGYLVVDVYKDIERYRVNGKGKLHQPSGTRSDRPEFNRMLSDIDNGKIDLVIAQREDRLYRGANLAMLEINERVKQKIVNIELARDFYHPHMAGGKAWAADIELRAKHERLVMGVTGRILRGKVWNNSPPYGYKRVDGIYIVNEEEAYWIRKIWKWYAEGESYNAINKRLIAEGAPRRKAKKRPWEVSVISRILHDDKLVTGERVINWDSKVYTFKVAPIVTDENIIVAVTKRLANHKSYPASNMKAQALIAGLCYCKACNARMSAGSKLAKRANGEKVRRPRYECPMPHQRAAFDGCAKSVAIPKIDGEVWQRLWELFADPVEFERRLEARIAALREQEANAGETCEKLNNRLAEIGLQRQWVITMARKGIITEDDMGTQLGALEIERLGLERELSEKSLLVGGKAERLIEVAQIYRERVMHGFETINEPPIDEEDARKKFELKKKYAQSLVTRVEIAEDKTVKVYTELDFYDDPITCGLASKLASDLFGIALVL